MSRVPQIYIAGPYSGADAARVNANCFHAITAAQEVARMGAYPVVPHALGLWCWDEAGQDPDWWYEVTLEQARRCDALLALHGWQGSTGSIREYETLEGMGKPVFTMMREVRSWLRKLAQD